MNTTLSRRELLKNGAVSAAGLMIPFSLFADERARISEWLGDGESLDLSDSDQARLAAWTTTLRREAPAPRRLSLGRRAIRVGELAVGTPYEAFTLEAYLRAGAILRALSRSRCRSPGLTA